MSRARSRGAKAVGLLGEVMLTLAALVALFLVWQLWWTDVVSQRGQDQILGELDQGWGDLDTRSIAPPQAGDPPVIDTPEDGVVWGTLWVPDFPRERIPLAEGVDRERVLNVKGAGHYPQTALPGEVGNFSVAGHRNTYGRPFYDIASLRKGSVLVVETEKTFYIYKVTASEVVEPSDVGVIAPDPDDPSAEPSRRLLTLTACHPMYSDRERYIVHAELTSWTKREDGIPKELVGTSAAPSDSAG
ncbi:class E sortase [Brachybacterium subflavum]|uniref:class E sortase n=1 Tax=Brachybacterium subflavum TaxID=2585206 RepID=UPI0012662D38|nr:class E sortase [Brachybacterium subflavum]